MKTLENLKELTANIPVGSQSHREATDYDFFFHSILRARINHCANNLVINKNNATKNISGQIISWKGGHFSFPVYKAMLEAKDQNFKDWSALVWQQIVCQMYLNYDKEDTYEFMVATEIMLVSNENNIIR